MEFRVIDRKSLDVPAWDALTKNASFFHTHQWVDTCVDGLSPGSHAEFLCGFEDDSLVAGMPAVITKQLFLKSFYSMPYGTYGEVILDDGANGNTRDEFYVHLVRYLKNGKFSRISITDFDRNLSELVEPFVRHKNVFTHIIYLDTENGHSSADKKTSQHIRSGERADTEICRVRSRDQLNEFYRLYEMTEKRHGSIRNLYTKHFFASVLKHLGDSEMMSWTCLNADGEMIGSRINFIYNDSMFNWQNVWNYEYRHLKPNYVLLSDSIRMAVENKIRTINLGSSPPDAHSLIHFKERWGGTKVEYDSYLSDSWFRKFFGRLSGS